MVRLYGLNGEILDVHYSIDARELVATGNYFYDPPESIQVTAEIKPARGRKPKVVIPPFEPTGD
jgi:hypothetical protein